MEFINFLQSFSNPVLDSIFTFITRMGEETFFMLVFILFFWCIDKGFGYRLGFAFLSSGVLNTWIKEIFRLPRPFQEHPEIRSLRVETATGFSFPSGHTQSTATLWTSAAIRYKRAMITVAAAIFIVFVGTSRMYLGVHYPRDVVFGALLGIAWVFASNWLFDLIEGGKKALLLVFLIPAILLPIVFQTADCAKAAGTVAGFVAGYLIESKYIKFETKSSMVKQIIKLVVGLGILVLIKVGVKVILPQLMICDFFRYMLMGLWVTVGAPYLFKRFLISDR